MSTDSLSLTDSLKIRNVKGILYLSIILALLNPLFFFLDFTMYPDHSSSFIGLRIFLQMIAGIYMATLVIEQAKRVNWGTFELVSSSDRDDPSPLNQTTEFDA